MPTLTQEPTSFRAGDKVVWTKSLGDYPVADGWSLKYRLGNESANQEAVTAEGSGTDYTLTISRTVSAAYAAGRYTLIGWVEKTGDRETIYQGTITVEPDLAETTVPIDTRSHYRKILDALEAMIERRATHEEEQYVADQVGATLVSPRDLLDTHQRYLRLYEEELLDARVANGEPAGNMHKFRLDPVS